jgi:hypothetical protein
MKKRTVLFFVYDGFADCQTSYALTGIRMSDIHRLKTIAVKREPIHSASGLTVLPDLDFFPETDLSDIDNSTVAMLILPDEFTLAQHAPIVKLLIAHCLQNDIPVVSTCNSTLPIHSVALLDNINAGIGSQLSYLDRSTSSYQYRDDDRNTPGAQNENFVTIKGLTSISFANAVFELLNIRNNFRLAAWFNELIDEVIG